MWKIKTQNAIIALKHWKYSKNLQASPCLWWKAQAVQPALSAWDPGCPCTDSEWSSGLLCKYDKTQSSVLSVYSWDPHPGLGHLSPASGKKRYFVDQVNHSTFRHSGKGGSPSNTAINNERQCKNYNGSVATAYLFARNEGHEDVVTDCGGGNIGTWCIKLRIAKFLPVLKEKTHKNQVPYFSQSPVEEKCTKCTRNAQIPVQTFLLATALEAFLVSILKVRTI